MNVAIESHRNKAGWIMQDAVKGKQKVRPIGSSQEKRTSQSFSMSLGNNEWTSRHGA